ncbi:MAG: hypothetical protein ED559_01335 [Phycisphaera sp.]|nr:MAG: hypothetical protein ED559_01335 [Phycisphaera sp.]
MVKSNHIPFEDWVDWMFNRQDDQWPWGDDRGLRSNWFRNNRLMAEHFIELHRNSVKSLKDLTNFQIGNGLWNLYTAALGLSPLDGNGIHAKLHYEMIASLVPMLQQLLPERVPHHEGYANDRISDAVYMFWDSAPVSPFRKNHTDRELLDVCISEMQQALNVKHPAAHKHALHGLGEFHLDIPDRAKSIIDEWLEQNPYVLDSIRNYAVKARVGDVL